MALAQAGHGGDAPRTTHGGSDEDKLDFEYEQADAFWRSVLRLGVQCIAGKDVLDLGCGWGGKAIYYAQHGNPRSVTRDGSAGLYDPGVPQRARGRSRSPRHPFLYRFGRDAPIRRRSFDVVLLDDVLEHVRDVGTVLRECHRVLRPGGRVYASFPSIKMAAAHHFDRVTVLPGLHWIMA